MAWITVEYGDGVEKHIHTPNIVEVTVTPARESGWDEERGERIQPSPLTVEVITTAPDSTYNDGGDYPDRVREVTRPYTVTLYGEQAESFLKAWRRAAEVWR